MFRKGAPKASMALAHYRITIVYNVLARGEQYVELGFRGWWLGWPSWASAGLV